MTHKPYQKQHLHFQGLPPDEQLAHSREFLAQMRTRRTVRDFSTEFVPFELIENAITAAATAPSGANQQPWTFVVVSDPTIKHAIRTAAEAEEKESYAHRMSEEWLNARAPLGTDWHKPHLQDAPYLIVIFRQSYGVKVGDVTRIKHYYSEESVGIAVGMLLCSLHLAGLATLTHTPTSMGFLNEILQRPVNERPFVVIPMGYPVQNATMAVITKKPISDVMIHFEEQK